MLPPLTEKDRAVTDQNEDPWAKEPGSSPADYLRYLKGRQALAAEFRKRAAEGLFAASGAEKAVRAVAQADTGGCDGDIGEAADDALAELRAAGQHLRNAYRIAIGHERDLRDEIAAAAREAAS
jgi:hypothetical protein